MNEPDLENLERDWTDVERFKKFSVHVLVIGEQNLSAQWYLARDKVGYGDIFEEFK